MTNSPNWISVSLQLGYPKAGPGFIDGGRTVADGTVYPSIPIGTIAYFRDAGTTQLGGGTFIFLPGVTSTVAGDVVTYRAGNGGGIGQDVNGGAVTARWTGTANTGFPLAVATAATDLQTKWGWYQIQGSAIVNVSGTVSAGQAAYYGQTATLETNAAVGGKQVIGAVSASANNVPDTGKAIFTLNNPVVQSQIT